MKDFYETFVTTAQAAKMLGVSQGTVQSWVEKGTLEAWKTVGGHRRIAQSSVERVLKERGGKRGVDGRRQPRAVVLLVEDDANVQEFYRLQIESWQLPLEVRTAGNGFDGLIQIGRHTPDLVIADLMMPGMDGFEMIRAVFGRPELKRVRVVAVTVMSPQDIISRGGLPGAVEVMTKPLDFSRLRAIAQEVVAALAERG